MQATCYRRMTPVEIAKQINEEIKNVCSQIDEQKRVIKRSVAKSRAIQDAEGELQALHTRLTVLTQNLAKLDPPPETSAS